MPNPTLVIVVQVKSKVRFLSHAQSVELHALDASGALLGQRSYPAKGEEVWLDAGTYVLVGEPIRGVGCQVLEGTISIIQPTGGEDPWPDPQVVTQRGGQNPFPVPGSMSDEVKDYAKKLMG